MLAGCAQSTSGTPSAASARPTATSSSTATSAPTGVTAAGLDKIVLQAADLPGWKATPDTSSPDDPADQAAMAKCVGTRNTDKDLVAEANALQFTLGGATVSSSASKYRSQSDIDADLAFVRSPKSSACFATLFKKQVSSDLPAGATIESTIFKITPGSADGPRNLVGTGTGKIVLKAGGQRLAVYVNFAFITGRLIEAEVDSENVGAPLSAATERSLVAKVAGRAAKA